MADQAAAAAIAAAAAALAPDLKRKLPATDIDNTALLAPGVRGTSLAMLPGYGPPQPPGSSVGQTAASVLALYPGLGARLAGQIGAGMVAPGMVAPGFPPGMSMLMPGGGMPPPGMPPLGMPGMMPGMPGMMPMPQIAPAMPDVARLLLDPKRTGLVIGKSGSGLKEIRLQTGAQFELKRDPVYIQGGPLGGERLLVVKPPLESQSQCLILVCSKLAGGTEGVSAAASVDGVEVTPSAPKAVSIGLLIPKQVAGRVVGKGGAGLKDIRALGLKVDMTRDEPIPGDRLLRLTGEALCVSSAIHNVLLLMSGPRQSPPGVL